ncbi:hypothetical protein V6Z12_D01G066700 [Gossypium hirsutum]
MRLFHVNACSHVSSSMSGSCPRTSSTQDQAWYPNFGATNHITPDVKNLSIVSPYTGRVSAVTSKGCSSRSRCVQELTLCWTICQG